MTISVVHHPNAGSSDLIISEPAGGRVVIKLPPHQADLLHVEFDLVITLLRDLVEDFPARVTPPRSLMLAQAYLAEPTAEE